MSAAGASAISVLQVRFDDFQELLGVSVESIGATPSHRWLTGANGQRIDKVLLAKNAHYIVVTSHGGAAVREAINLALRQAGIKETNELSLFAQTHFQREILSILPQIHGSAGVSVALSALAREPEFQLQCKLDADTRIGLSESAKEFGRFTTRPRVQLWGQVNVGKSSLLNALAARELASVGDQPGLTRDIIEGVMQHNGYEIRIFDAPGQMADATGIDASAIELARQWRKQADLTIELVAPDTEPSGAGDWVIACKIDEHPASGAGISVNIPETITALKDRLIAHFYGFETSEMLALTPALRNKLLNNFD